jgi:release factor glutamine methyltransferase
MAADVSRVAAPPGVQHFFGRVRSGQLLFRWRGRELAVRRDEGGRVLFPSDVGLALTAALDRAPEIDLQGRRVLDVGCGCGIYTVAALADGAALVAALDVNPACMAVTSENLVANGLPAESMEPVVADLAGLVVSQPWDVVLANPPHLPDEPSGAAADGEHTALMGGVDGRALYDTLLNRLDDLVAPGGVLVLAHSSLTDVDRTRAELSGRGYRCRTALIAEMDIPFRRFAPERHHILARLYELRRAGTAAFCGLRFEVHVLVATRTEER